MHSIIVCIYTESLIFIAGHIAAKNTSHKSTNYKNIKFLPVRRFVQHKTSGVSDGEMSGDSIYSPQGSDINRM